MSREYEDNAFIQPLTYPDAPCHTCIFQDGGGIGVYGKGDSVSCEKYPVPRFAFGVKGKPREILEGKQPCPFYQKEGG